MMRHRKTALNSTAVVFLSLNLVPLFSVQSDICSSSINPDRVNIPQISPWSLELRSYIKGRISFVAS
jgi:hypothetical protein